MDSQILSCHTPKTRQKCVKLYTAVYSHHQANSTTPCSLLWLVKTSRPHLKPISLHLNPIELISLAQTGRVNMTEHSVRKCSIKSARTRQWSQHCNVPPGTYCCWPLTKTRKRPGLLTFTDICVQGKMKYAQRKWNTAKGFLHKFPKCKKVKSFYKNP